MVLLNRKYYQIYYNYYDYYHHQQQQQNRLNNFSLFIYLRACSAAQRQR
jgi:hypothetical protein